MNNKLDFRHHKAILSVFLVVILVISFLYGIQLDQSSYKVPILAIATFSLIFLVFVLLLIATSVLIRMRDEVHSLHGETHQYIKEMHQVVRDVHGLTREVHATVHKGRRK